MIPNATFWKSTRDAAFANAPWAVYYACTSTTVNTKTGALTPAYTQYTVQVLPGPERKAEDNTHTRLFKVKAEKIPRMPAKNDKLTYAGETWWVMGATTDQWGIRYLIEAQRQ